MKLKAVYLFRCLCSEAEKIKMYERRCRGVDRMPKIRVTSLGGPCQFVYIFHKIQIEKLSVYNAEIDCV